MDRSGTRFGKRINAAIILRDRVIGIDEIKGRACKIILCAFDRLQPRVAGVELLRVDACLRHCRGNQDQADQNKSGQNSFAHRQSHEKFARNRLC